MPKDFDGGKFAKRYGLDALKGDFSIAYDMLIVKDETKITDDPPIFEAPDPPKLEIKQRLDNVKDLKELIAILKERL